MLVSGKVTYPAMSTCLLCCANAVSWAGMVAAAPVIWSLGCARVAAAHDNRRDVAPIIVNTLPLYPLRRPAIVVDSVPLQLRRGQRAWDFLGALWLRASRSPSTRVPRPPAVKCSSSGPVGDRQEHRGACIRAAVRFPPADRRTVARIATEGPRRGARGGGRHRVPAAADRRVADITPTAPTSPCADYGWLRRTSLTTSRGGAPYTDYTFCPEMEHVQCQQRSADLAGRLQWRR